MSLVGSWTLSHRPTDECPSARETLRTRRRHWSSRGRGPTWEVRQGLPTRCFRSGVLEDEEGTFVGKYRRVSLRVTEQ